MSEFWFYPVHLELCWVPGLCRAACSVRSVSVSIGNFSTHTFLFPTRSQPEPELWALVSGSWIAETSSRAVQKNAQVSPTCRVMVKESQHSHPNWDPGDRKWLWPEAKEAMGAAHFCPKCWLSFTPGFWGVQQQGCHCLARATVTVYNNTGSKGHLILGIAICLTVWVLSQAQAPCMSWSSP